MYQLYQCVIVLIIHSTTALLTSYILYMAQKSCKLVVLNMEICALQEFLLRNE